MPMCVCIHTFTLNANITCHIRCGTIHWYFIVFIHNFVWYVLPCQSRSSPLLLQILSRQHHDWRPKSLLSYRYMRTCLQTGKTIYSGTFYYQHFFQMNTYCRQLWSVKFFLKRSDNLNLGISSFPVRRVSSMNATTSPKATLCNFLS